MDNIVSLKDFRNKPLLTVKEAVQRENQLYDNMEYILDSINEMDCDGIVILVKDGKLLTASTHEDTEELLEMITTARAEIRGDLE